MKKGFDIHNYGRQVEGAIKSLKNSVVSERNKKTILDFTDFSITEGLSSPRIVRYIWVLKDMATTLEVGFDKATKEDIVRLIRKIQEKNLSPWTKNTYKIMVKRFYRWLKDTGDEYPEEVKWIKSGIKKTELNPLSNSDLITEEEVKKLIETAEHPRDKAFVSVLYESGTRIGEIGSLQIGNVKFDEYGVILNVVGKTGPRPIRIMMSTPYLTTWLQSHPFKDNDKAPLWVNIGNTKHHTLFKYANMRKLLKSLFIKAGVKKKFNPHTFRHSRATFLADHLTEFQMNQFFGWVQGSEMPSTYVHMSGKNIDSPLLELNGVKTEKKSKESCLKPKICPRCDTINSYDSKFCNKCAGILDIKTAYELDNKVKKEKEIRKTPDDLLNTLVKDKEFLEMFVNKIKEIGLGDKIAT